MSQPRILVDMDGVIASWGKAYDQMLDRAGVSAASIPRTENQINWDLTVGRTPEEREIIKRVMTHPGFYADLEPILGAKTALKRLLKQGFDVRIVSAPYISNPTCASDKLNWIVKHYGSHWAQRLILTMDKTLVRGDYLIDDKPEVTGEDRPTWRHLIFGDYAYNRYAPGFHVVDWAAALTVLDGAFTQDAVLV